jgi:hypothetical protein
MALLRKIPLECDLNKVIIQSLRTSVERLKLRDRHCILIFDEMSLQPSLTYNRPGQYINGFHELCGEERTCKIADHVLVFMLMLQSGSSPWPIFFLKMV